MTDRPIIFSGPMVRAILDGRKTQTRRVLKPQPDESYAFLGYYAPGISAVFEDASFDARPDLSIRLLTPGVRLWVRETWAHVNAIGTDAKNEDEPQTTLYRATCSGMGKYRWRPSIHMPRKHSRLTLTVTDVRVQRVQEIGNEDATAEGCSGFYSPAHPDMGQTDGQMPWEEFRDLWDSLNAKRGQGWSANPWVAAYTFTVERRNIDQ